jgi:hypothetical protein
MDLNKKYIDNNMIIIIGISQLVINKITIIVPNIIENLLPEINK